MNSLKDDDGITFELTAESTSQLFKMCEDLDLSNTTALIITDRYGNTEKYVKVGKDE